jgi:uncharacterized spore protein YtfJ
LVSLECKGSEVGDSGKDERSGQKIIPLQKVMFGVFSGKDEGGQYLTA